MCATWRRSERVSDSRSSEAKTEPNESAQDNNISQRKRKTRKTHGQMIELRVTDGPKRQPSAPCRGPTVFIGALFSALNYPEFFSCVLSIHPFPVKVDENNVQ